MEKPKFILDSLLDNSIEDLKKILYKNGILYKDYTDDNLLLIYHKYNTPVKNFLVKESRSLVIDKNTKKIISYSCEIPNIINDQDSFSFYLNKIKENNSNENSCYATECYEGSLLSVFYINDKWYISTRRCLNSKDSKFNEKSHYDLFEDIILSSNNTINDFYDKLDKDKSYYFVLLHHLNKNIIDYSIKFNNKEYKYLCLISIRDNNLNEIDLYNNDNTFLCSNIFIPPIKTDFNDLYYKNYNHVPLKEGIIIKNWNYLTNKYNLIKILYKNYLFHHASINNNIFRGLIYLYQTNELNYYLKLNPIFLKINEINKLDIINNIFKVMTSEILQLFKNILKNSLNSKLLPIEYRNIIYFFKSFKNTDYSRLTLSYINNYLKNLNNTILINLILSRNKLFEYDEFKNISCYNTEDKLNLFKIGYDKINQ